jgi:hypothetical protein
MAHRPPNPKPKSMPPYHGRAALLRSRKASSNSKSRVSHSKSTLHLRLEPLIWVENTPLTRNFLGGQRSFCPTMTRELNNQNQKQTEQNWKIIQGLALDLGCANLLFQISFCPPASAR